MPYSRAELAHHSEKIGRGWRTLLRWVARGCDLNDPESVAKFLAEAERRKTNVQKSRERRGMYQPADTRHDKESETTHRRVEGMHATSGNGESLPAPGVDR